MFEVNEKYQIYKKVIMDEFMFLILLSMISRYLVSVIWRKEQKVLLNFSPFLSFHCPDSP